MGGGTALLLRVPWIEASVAGGKEVRVRARVFVCNAYICMKIWGRLYLAFVLVCLPVSFPGVEGVRGAGGADGAADRHHAVGQVGLGQEGDARPPRGHVRACCCWLMAYGGWILLEGDGDLGISRLLIVAIRMRSFVRVT